MPKNMTKQAPTPSSSSSSSQKKKQQKQNKLIKQPTKRRKLYLQDEIVVKEMEESEADQMSLPSNLTLAAYRAKAQRSLRQSSRLNKGIKRADPMVVLPYIVTEQIIRSLPTRSIVAIRRVSKLWKEQMEFCISPGWMNKNYALRETVKKANKEDEKWAAKAFGKSAYQDEMQTTASPTFVKKFTNATTWVICGERMVWMTVEEICVEHLSPWNQTERENTLHNLAQNPAGIQRNKELMQLIDDCKPATADRPKREKAQGKHERLTVRWNTMEVLKTRRAKVSINSLIAVGTETVLIDYCQNAETNQDIRAPIVLGHHTYPFISTVNKLAMVNIVTGYPIWIVTLDSPSRGLAFPPYGSYWSRSRHHAGQASYIISNDKLIAFTTKGRVHAITLAVNQTDHGILLTIRNVNNGSIICEERATDQYPGETFNYRRPDHFLPHPDGKTIITVADSTFYLYSTTTAKLIRKIKMPIMEGYWPGFSYNATYDLIFMPDDKTLALVEGTIGDDFACYYIDTTTNYKITHYEKLHTAPPYTRVLKTKYNPALGVQVIFTRSPVPAINNEWRPEISRFTPLKRFLAGVPEELYAAEWKFRVPNAEKWNWSPNNQLDNSHNPFPFPFASQGGTAAHTSYLQNLQNLQHNMNLATAQLQAISHPPPHISHAIGPNTNFFMTTHQPPALTPRQTALLDIAFIDMVCTSRNGVTLPPQKLKQKQVHTRKKRGTQMVIERTLKNGRRPFWMNGRLGPQRVIMGERFLCFDQEDCVYVCDFGRGL